MVVGPSGALVHPAPVAHGEHDVDVHERLLLGLWFAWWGGGPAPTRRYIQGHGPVQNAKVMAQILAVDLDLPDLGFVLTDS